ncbi:tetratricopeptide repeat protein 1 [Phtheirospermum japonicum]|uniref:Tetratricopeptide repeat protein 1 n=1 Tax=Phtheirospermum japonicum TaxID=374723 RepID=A0A830D9N6_9LAMI|nr:tetratricopeptide repeat protein 1 [Phtheirospermum japonicum]
MFKFQNFWDDPAADPLRFQLNNDFVGNANMISAILHEEQLYGLVVFRNGVCTLYLMEGVDNEQNPPIQIMIPSTSLLEGEDIVASPYGPGLLVRNQVDPIGLNRRIYLGSWVSDCLMINYDGVELQWQIINPCQHLDPDHGQCTCRSCGEGILSSSFPPPIEFESKKSCEFALTAPVNKDDNYTPIRPVPFGTSRPVTGQGRFGYYHRPAGRRNWGPQGICRQKIIRFGSLGFHLLTQFSKNPILHIVADPISINIISIFSCFGLAIKSRRNTSFSIKGLSSSLIRVRFRSAIDDASPIEFSSD